MVPSVTKVIPIGYNIVWPDNDLAEFYRSTIKQLIAAKAAAFLLVVYLANSVASEAKLKEVIVLPPYADLKNVVQLKKGGAPVHQNSSPDERLGLEQRNVELYDFLHGRMLFVPVIPNLGTIKKTVRKVWWAAPFVLS